MKRKIAKYFPKNLKIRGLTIQTGKFGIKSNIREDISVLVFEDLVPVGYVLTNSKTCASNIIWLKKIRSHGKARVLIVNSGNANAYTGKEGNDNIKKIISYISSKIGCRKEEVIVSSTGVIGEQLPINKIMKQLPGLLAISKNNNNQDWIKFAKSIMTTDTFPKAVIKNTKINGKSIKIIGIAKGSGMIAPNMATMLGFIFTDANLSKNILSALIKETTKETFNCITVDGDMSTNDMVALFATCKVNCGKITTIKDKKLNDFKKTLYEVSLSLSKKIIIDGEGAKKLVEVIVKGAFSDADAKKVALSISNSPLVKTAIAGEDANWGRIIMAIGKADVKLKQQKLSLAIGNQNIITKGKLIENYNELTVAKYLKQENICILVDMHIGKGKSKTWTCDLTKKYIEINADYRS